jgi:putative peptide zinc metalloprotease protein
MTEPAKPNMWDRLAAQETPAPEAPSLWATLQERSDPTQMHPRRIAEWELAEVGGLPGRRRYVLKNLRNGAYLHLSEIDVFLWNLMDGSRAIKALVIELFVERKRYAPDAVIKLVGLLKANGFLETRHTSVFESLTGRLLGQRFVARVRVALGAIRHTRLAIPNADGHFSAVYRRFRWLFYTRAGLLIGLLLFLVDITLYPWLLFTRPGSMLTVGGRYQWGLLALVLVFSLSILIHEYAHALTSKHFGREVNHAGFLLHFGMPAFFVDTTDMWMTRKWPRIAVSWAGPYSNALIGGAALLVYSFAPPSWPHDLLWTIASLNTYFFLAQLLPIVESDGDYILMDLLEITQLRQRAFAFLRRGMWRKLWRREAFGRQDAILGGYGLIALGGIVYVIAIAVRLWLTSGVALLRALAASPLLALQASVPVVVLAVLLYLVRFGVPRVQRAVNSWRVVEDRLEGR